MTAQQSVASRAWLGLALAVLVAGGPGCRRARLARGDAAPVVVAALPRDGAPAHRLAEREPNDSPEQAQLLVLNPEWPVFDVEGSLTAQPGSQPTRPAGKQPGKDEGKDVDVFKLLIPGGNPGERPSGALDSAPLEDARRLARRLSLQLTADPGAGVTLQLLDDELKVMETVSGDNGEMVGMPNMAVAPGRLYYMRVKAGLRAGKSAVPPPSCNYKLSVQLGDFDVADEREPNDSMDSANPVLMTGMAELAGFHGWQRDQDFYRVPSPDVASALDVTLDGVEGVTAGLQVLSGTGVKLATARGRKGEKVALHNVRIAPGAVDAGVALSPSSSFFVVVRAEAGQNPTQRYVLHLSLGALRQDAEVEPNDTPATASPARDGTVTGFLPAGDVDYFLYGSDSREPRELTVEVAFPAHVRGKVELSRPAKAELVVSAETKKSHQQIELSKIATLGEPLLLRIAPAKGEGNANEPYSLRISSEPTAAEAQTPQIHLSP